MRELLCIQTHSEKKVVAGNVYPLLGEMDGPCVHAPKMYDIGFVSKATLFVCGICGAGINKPAGVYWRSSKLFAEIATQEEVCKKETVEAEG